MHWLKEKFSDQVFQIRSIIFESDQESDQESDLESNSEDQTSFESPSSENSSKKMEIKSLPTDMKINQSINRIKQKIFTKYQVQYSDNFQNYKQEIFQNKLKERRLKILSQKESTQQRTLQSSFDYFQTEKSQKTQENVKSTQFLVKGQKQDEKKSSKDILNQIQRVKNKLKIKNYASIENPGEHSSSKQLQEGKAFQLNQKAQKQHKDNFQENNKINYKFKQIKLKRNLMQFVIYLSVILCAYAAFSIPNLLRASNYANHS